MFESGCDSAGQQGLFRSRNKGRISGGSAIIEGMFSPEEAHDLALVLRAGSLPAPVKILENRTVGPSLGEDSIKSGRNAIVPGMLMIVIGMALYYKWSGLVADIRSVFQPDIDLRRHGFPWPKGHTHPPRTCRGCPHYRYGNRPQCT